MRNKIIFCTGYSYPYPFIGHSFCSFSMLETFFCSLSMLKHYSLHFFKVWNVNFAVYHIWNIAYLFQICQCLQLHTVGSLSLHGTLFYRLAKSRNIFCSFLKSGTIFCRLSKSGKKFAVCPSPVHMYMQ